MKKNPARDTGSPDSKNAAPTAASAAAHMHTATRDRVRARHGQRMQVSAAPDVPDLDMVLPSVPDFDVMSLPCIDDVELPPVRTEVRLPRRNRTRVRQDAAPAPDLSASMAAAAEFRRSGGLARFHEEMMEFGAEFRKRGGTLIDNAANRRILAEMWSVQRSRENQS